MFLTWNLTASTPISDAILINSNGNIHDRPILTFIGLPINENDECYLGINLEDIKLVSWQKNPRVIAGL